ncbi:MAG: trypsin-like serine protease [Verrucomicrobiota bacterium]|nr:trypsin-like serine protease [Verrucomicrobiota bacterium]
MTQSLRRSVAVVLLALGTSLLVIVTAQAITNGAPDGNAHPNVGGLVAPKAYSDGTWIYCSGTLISPTVFLTAAHCAEGSRVRVTFDSAYQNGDATFTGTWHADPAYGHDQSDPHDIAVVVFDKPVKGIVPARLPAAGSLSGVPNNQQFTSVGYGAYEVTNQPGGHRYLYNDVRGVATGTLNSITPAWLRISMNPATGNGGTCYGDSGGPNFLGTTNIVAATTITGDAVCRATNTAYRTDTESARAFLRQFVFLP